MQVTSAQFARQAKGYVRPLSWNVLASFDKVYDSGLTFFTLDVSELDSDAILGTTDDDTIKEWDKYFYADYSSRVVNIEVTREFIEPYSVVQAFADVTLNNYDRYFTPASGSPIQDYILPKRPFKLLLGFGGENVAKFVGMSDGMPTLNKSDRTATFHLRDFLSFIFDKSFPNDMLLVDNTTDEVLDEIFQAIGLDPSQYVLEASSNVVPYFVVGAGQNIGAEIKKLMEAELGRLFMDELGMIRFINRATVETTSVYRFDKQNTIDYSVSTEDDIINRAIVTIEMLEEEALQSVAMSEEVISIAAGASDTIVIDTSDTITAANTPTYQTSAISDSYYLAFNAASGGTAYSSITVTSFTALNNSVSITFNNGGGVTGYIRVIDIWGTPIKVVRTATVEDSDPASIAKYDEEVYEFTTRYIEDDDEALSRVSSIVNELSEYGRIVDIDVKGSPALQNGDCIDLGLDGYQGEFNIRKIVDIYSDGRYQQRIQSRLRVPGTVFILDSSGLNGDHYLGP